MIKFVHVRSNFKYKNKSDNLFFQEGTIAIELPTKEYLTTLFTSHSNKAVINTGISKLNPSDQFCKKTGRSLSSARVSFKVADLVKIVINGIRHDYYFEFNDTGVATIPTYRLVLSTTVESNNVHLIEGSFNKVY